VLAKPEGDEHGTRCSQRDVPRGVKERQAERGGRKNKEIERNQLFQPPLCRGIASREVLVALRGSANQTGKQRFLRYSKSLMKS